MSFSQHLTKIDRKSSYNGAKTARVSAEKFSGGSTIKSPQNSKKIPKNSLLSLFQGGGEGNAKKDRKIAKNNEK